MAARPGSKAQPSRRAEGGAPALRLLDDLRGHRLCISDAYAVGMLDRLLGEECRAIPPEDHRLVQRSKAVGDLVGPRGVVGHAGDADEIRLSIEIDGLDVLVKDPGLHFGGMAAAGTDRLESMEKRKRAAREAGGWIRPAGRAKSD